jgi:beta-glucosidase
VDLDDHLMFLDPILGGRSTLTSLGDDDLALISAPIDFLGVNYYRRLLVRAGSAGEPEQVLPHGVPVTGNNWPIQPDGLRDELIALRDTYPSLPPLYITENGAALPDPSRIDYLRRHLHAVHAAIAAGVDVRGYFVWTLMDNFEWADGYATKFGIVSVDRDDDLRRTPRASARWYERVARENTVP